MRGTQPRLNLDHRFSRPSSPREELLEALGRAKEQPSPSSSASQSPRASPIPRASPRLQGQNHQEANQGLPYGTDEPEPDVRRFPTRREYLRDPQGAVSSSTPVFCASRRENHSPAAAFAPYLAEPTGVRAAPCAPPPYPVLPPSSGYPHPQVQTHMPVYGYPGYSGYPGTFPAPSAPHQDWALTYRFKNGEIKNLNFNGDSAKYRHWRREIERHLLQAGIYDAQTTIDVLANNTEGRPKEFIEQISSSGNQTPDAALEFIWGTLERKYGSPEQAAEALHQQVKDFRAVSDSRSDAEVAALENFLVLVNRILLASKASASSAWYTSSTGIGLLCQKTPRPFQDRWRKEHTRLMEARKPITLEAFRNVFERYVNEVSNPAFRDTQTRHKTKALLTSSVEETLRADPSEVSKGAQGVSGSKSAFKIPLYRCFKFKKLSREERWKEIKDQKRCQRCLDSRHGTDNCTLDWKCLNCDSPKHHWLLCSKDRKSGKQNKGKNQPKNNSKSGPNRVKDRNEANNGQPSKQNSSQEVRESASRNNEGQSA